MAKLYQYQRFGCLIVSKEIEHEDAYDAHATVKPLTDMFPSSGHIDIQYSLNKQKRWELLAWIECLVETANPCVQVNIQG